MNLATLPDAWATFDSETTGLEAMAEIVSWALVAPDGNVLGQGFVKPSVAISPGALALHGITSEQLANAPVFDDVWPQLRGLLAQRQIIAYNASFESARLLASAKRSAREVLAYFAAYPWYCAMEHFAALYGEERWGGGWKWQRFETACAYYDIKNDRPHDAASDAIATAQLVHAMKKEETAGSSAV